MTLVQKELISFAHMASQGLRPIQQFTLRMAICKYRGVPYCNRTADPAQIPAKLKGIFFDLMSMYGVGRKRDRGIKSEERCGERRH